MRTREVIIRMLKRQKWTVPGLAKELEISKQGAAYYIKVVRSKPHFGLRWERIDNEAIQYWID